MNNAVKTALLLIALGIVIAIAPPSNTSPRQEHTQHTASADLPLLGNHL
jgi:hypothetical protein